jgi:hypothetical protein
MDTHKERKGAVAFGSFHRFEAVGLHIRQHIEGLTE